MSSTFTCRQCISRLAQSNFGQLKFKHFQLHTQAASTTATFPPPWDLPEEQRRDIASDHEIQLPTYFPTPAPPVPQIQPAEKKQLEEKIKKFVPRQNELFKEKIRAMPVAGSRDLKRKILQCRGDYYLVHDDLMTRYGLSNAEALHAVTQLERLLWGRSAAEAGSRLDVFHDWKMHFQELSQLTDDPVEKLKVVSLLRRDAKTVKDIWLRLDPQKRKSVWPDLMLSSFRSNPGHLRSLVMATFHHSLCPSFVVEDLVYFLLRLLDDPQSSEKKRQYGIDLVFFLLANSPPKYLAFPQTTIREVLSWLSVSGPISFYDALTRVDHPLRPNTLLHFASRFAKDPLRKVEAAEIIHSLSSRPGFDINSPAAASVCTSLLTLEKGAELPDDHAAPDELFKMLLDAGFRPNLINLSALMRNFCVRGRVEIAWNIFDLLIERGIEPDAHVFSILLNGSKQTLDMESLERNVNMIEASNAWTPHLVNDFLDFIYRYNELYTVKGRRQQKGNTELAWRLMARLYIKFFDPTALQQFTPFPLENLLIPRQRKPPAHLAQLDKLVDSLPTRPDALLMWPDTVTLKLMLKVHLRSLSTVKALVKHGNYVKAMILKYTKDPIISQLLKDQKGWLDNLFLRGSLQFKPTVSASFRMLRNMREKAKWEEQRYGTNKYCYPPSVYTYTILMKGMRNHKHTRGVLLALKKMVEEGITPNIAAWNAIIGALLRENLITAAVRVMRHVEAIGLQTNARTMREITTRPLWKQRRLDALLKKEPPSTAKSKRDTRDFVEWLWHVWERRGKEEVQHMPMREVRRILREDAKKEDAEPEDTGLEY
ncbi:uncharacterized protein F4822DRAFT_398478 [Hypoxylon trugodes]|uniref:uncharacterized protein n=1 Tax=Hypoxylon trugodes TaxID=326681 RepID=UPI00218F48A4|nr:uncharacterized protein F4822DRAFT_398478 [Hypoxylon trugodes]KAI1389483.1 hypothetical protein F4822DRAFT_398478 [Hypoxylon trugodes]